MPAADLPLPKPRSVVLDCADPRSLAGFYGELLGGSVHDEDPDWCEVRLADPVVRLAFQRVAAYTPPDWPSGQPQQIHLDLTVSDIESASRRAVGLGARVLDGTVDEGNSMFRVHKDPEGHPFCLCEDKPGTT